MGTREPERLGLDEVKQLARDIVTNVVYAPLDPEAIECSIECSFGVMMALGGLSDYDLSKIGLVYERFDRANEMAVNGFPTFYSMKLLHADDYGILVAEVTRMQEALR